jgi:hypothetical protein
MTNGILKNVREKIAVSNLEKEYIMKSKLKKQIMTFSLVAVLFLSGGFFTVNAVTNGELVNNVKETIEKTGKEYIKGNKLVRLHEDGRVEEITELTGEKVYNMYRDGRVEEVPKLEE